MYNAFMTDDNQNQLPDDDVISLDSATEPDEQSSSDLPPAQSDMTSASGHAPDLEADDDVDDLGEEAGLSYAPDEELGIDHKVQINTTSEPPSPDTPS